MSRFISLMDEYDRRRIGICVDDISLIASKDGGGTTIKMKSGDVRRVAESYDRVWSMIGQISDGKKETE